MMRASLILFVGLAVSAIAPSGWAQTQPTNAAAAAPASAAPAPTTAGSTERAPDAGYTPEPVATTYRRLSGRLFFSAAERERIDRARVSGVEVINDIVVAREPKLNGFVKQSGGRATFWVDGTKHVSNTKDRIPEVSSSAIGAPRTVRFVPSEDATNKAVANKGAVSMVAPPAVAAKPPTRAANPKAPPRP